MQNEIIEPLIQIIDHSNDILVNSSLNDVQREFANAIYNEAIRLRDLVITLSEITVERVRELFDFEARSHLTSIIGYAEMLLDEEDGELSHGQRKFLLEIRTASKHLLRAITQSND